MENKEYYRFISNRMQIKWRKLGNGMLLKYADKMFMKKKYDKELKTEIKQVMKNYDETKQRDLSLPENKIE